MKKEPRKIDLDMARQPGVRMKWCEAHKHFHPHYFKCKEQPQVIDRTGGSTMKNFISALLVAVTLVPAGLVPTKSPDVSERINATLKEQEANGKRYAFIDLDNLSWKEIKAYRVALEKLGYKADFAGGYRNANGAIKVQW